MITINDVLRSIQFYGIEIQDVIVNSSILKFTINTSDVEDHEKLIEILQELGTLFKEQAFKVDFEDNYRYTVVMQ